MTLTLPPVYARFLPACALLLPALALAGEASGGRPPSTVDDLFHAMAADAQAIFVGEVVSVDYRESDPNLRGGTTPHTFITWRVEQDLKGMERAQTFTARFLGGPTDDGGRIVRVSEMSEFDLGDRDVLFVTNNGEYACPLVRGADRRVRLLEGGAYTDAGRALQVEDGSVAFGGLFDFTEIRETTINGYTFGSTGDETPRDEDDDDGKPGAASSEADFIAWLARVAADYPAEHPVESVDIRDTFTLELE